MQNWSLKSEVNISLKRKLTIYYSWPLLKGTHVIAVLAQGQAFFRTEISSKSLEKVSKSSKTKDDNIEETSRLTLLLLWQQVKRENGLRREGFIILFFTSSFAFLQNKLECLLSPSISELF